MICLALTSVVGIYTLMLNLDYSRSEIKKLETIYLSIMLSVLTLYPKQVAEDIRNFEGDSLLDLSKNWTGRWLLIRGNELITDATGLMSAFYWTRGNEWIISSSLALLAEVLGYPIKDSVQTSGLDWHLLPRTIMPNVNALFCTQQLRLPINLRYCPLSVS